MASPIPAAPPPPPTPPAPGARQRSFDDLGTPLSEVTFVVLDLETTGGSPATCEITEVGAVKVRGGELLGTFQTLVNPGVAIPPEITYLTGITTTMVGPAPRIEAVLPSLLAFLGDATVVVGHNIRFDLSFLDAALVRHGYGRLRHRSVDTCALARRLMRDEVPNCKLSTLAAYVRTAHTPNHRALEDAWATTEVFHALLERAGTFGVLGLDDLLVLPKLGGHPQLAKLRLAAALPRRPGVYLFRDGLGRVMYVGKAVDLRRRVRSYFTSDDRRKIGAMLRELTAIDHIECAGELEAAVLEVRLIHELTPRFNRRSKHWRAYAYLKLTLDERFPRLAVVRTPNAGDGCIYLGPLASTATAKQVAEAIETAVPIRRCTARPARPGAPPVRDWPCAPAQLGVAACPCAGEIGQAEYGRLVDQVVDGLTGDPEVLLGPLRVRMQALAATGRYEEAADVRDRAAALSRALWRQRRLDALRAAGRIELELPGEGRTVVVHGVLRDAWPAAVGDDGPMRLPLDAPPPPPGVPLPRTLVDEVATIAAWLEQRAGRLRLVACDGVLAWPVQRPAPFDPVTRAGR